MRFKLIHCHSPEKFPTGWLISFLIHEKSWGKVLRVKTIIFHHMLREGEKRGGGEKANFQTEAKRKQPQRLSKRQSEFQTPSLFSFPICPWCPSKHHLTFSRSLLKVFFYYETAFIVNLVTSLTALLAVFSASPFWGEFSPLRTNRWNWIM